MVGFLIFQSGVLFGFCPASSRAQYPRPGTGIWWRSQVLPSPRPDRPNSLASVSIGVDHELLRNLILTAETAWSEDDYNGLDRTDTRFAASFSAIYRLDRRYGLTAGLAYLDQSSSGMAAGPTYRSTRLSIAVVSQF